LIKVNTEFKGNDLNVVGAWESGVTGTGVTVAFIDDGIDHENEDLSDNFSLKGSWDFNFNKNLPTPSLPDDIHGTRCAGEVGAVKNNVCGVGVAYNAKVAGVRLLSGKITNYDQAAAVNYAWDINQIYSCSWGPLDDGRTMESPSKMVSDAFKNGALSGRSGLGSIYVFAAGNGGFHHDNCNFDGYTNSIYTITISAMDKRQNHPTYSEQCPAILMTAYSSSNGNANGIYTSDWRTGCTQSHGGSDILIRNICGSSIGFWNICPCVIS
jgi:kexin